MLPQLQEESISIENVDDDVVPPLPKVHIAIKNHFVIWPWRNNSCAYDAALIVAIVLLCGKSNSWHPLQKLASQYTVVVSQNLGQAKTSAALEALRDDFRNVMYQEVFGSQSNHNSLGIVSASSIIEKMLSIFSAGKKRIDMPIIVPSTKMINWNCEAATEGAELVAFEFVTRQSDRIIEDIEHYNNLEVLRRFKVNEQNYVLFAVILASSIHFRTHLYIGDDESAKLVPPGSKLSAGVYCVDPLGASTNMDNGEKCELASYIGPLPTNTKVDNINWKKSAEFHPHIILYRKI